MFVGNSVPRSELSGFSIGEEGTLSLAIFTEASRWSELFVASLQWRRGGNFVNYQLPYVWIEGLIALLFVWVLDQQGFIFAGEGFPQICGLWITKYK